jgi:hypothetical protein
LLAGQIEQYISIPSMSNIPYKMSFRDWGRDDQLLFDWLID